MKKLSYYFLFVLQSIIPAIAQTTDAYTSGTTTWTVPACVTSITVEAWGGGGGGGAVWSRFSPTASGPGSEEACTAAGGGGGGGYVRRVYTVVPGEVYTINVGVGGAGGTASGTTNGANNGSPGGNSTFSGPATIGPGILRAFGGNGGGAANFLRSCLGGCSGATHQGVNGTGGTGGTGANATTTFTGGNGRPGVHSGSTEDRSGAGGGGAGTSANGGNASATTSNNTGGGIGGNVGGGNGAGGVMQPFGSGYLGTNGFNGNTLGGGGGGACGHNRARNIDTHRFNTGGNGARGEVRITYSSGASDPGITSTNATSITCLSSTAQASITYTNGSTTFNWSGPGITAGNGTGTITVNATGAYVYTATVGGCSSTGTINVSGNTNSITISSTSSGFLACNTTTAFASVTPVNTNTSVAWSGPGIISGNNSATITVNSPGIYTYTVTQNASLCTSINTIAVTTNTTPPTTTISPNSFSTSCASPTVQLSASGTGLTYTWTSPASGSLNNNNIANPIANGSGVFTVVATSTINGCSSPIATATVVADANIPVITLTSNSLSLTCSTTSQTVSVTSANPDLTYTWSPTPSSGQGTSDATFDTPDTYTIAVTNTVNGCVNSSLVSVDQNTIAPVLAAISDQTLTCALSSTSLTSSASPSVGTSYNWSGPGVLSGAASDVVTVNAGGAYTVIATAANGCTSSATANVIDNNTPITATVTPSSSITNITCTNSVVTLSATATPTNDIVFVWSTGGSSASESVSLPGVVTVTLVNSVTGCSTTAQFAVTQNTITPDVAFANTTFPCGPLTSTVNASSTNTNVSYTWSGTGIVSGTSSASPEINSPGTYSVTITDNVTGCSTSTTVVVGLATINASFTPSSNVGEVPAVISFSNQSTGATTYAWDFGDGGSSTDINPNYTYNTQGSYTVILTASSGLCVDTAATIIIIDEGFEVYIPNVFTPNNDGPNDVFYVKTKGVKDLQGDIFNRWGQLMYTLKNINDLWDGKAPNGELVPDGTYFYILNITDNKNKNTVYKGSVNLYR